MSREKMRDGLLQPQNNVSDGPDIFFGQEAVRLIASRTSMPPSQNH